MPTSRAGSTGSRAWGRGSHRRLRGPATRLAAVLAWRVGLAHYRAGALAAADALPAEIALAAVDGAAGVGGGWPALRQALVSADRWSAPGADRTRSRVVHCVGAFRGFGGAFLVPPRLLRSDGDLLVRSGTDAWILTADAFGATLHRASSGELAAGRVQEGGPAALRFGDGEVSWRGEAIALPVAGPATSFVLAEPMLALTTAASHAVVILALAARA